MKSRSLSPIEEFFYWRTELGIYTNFCIAADYDKFLEPSRVLDTIKLMCDEYPNLRTNVTKSNDKDVKFVYIEKIDFSDTVKVINDDSKAITDIFHEIQNDSFKYGDSKPLWKLIIFNKTKLIFYTDHLLCDGMSGVNFHRVFNEKYESKRSTKVESLLPSPDDLNPGYHAPFFSKCYIMLKESIPKALFNWIHYAFDPYKDLTYKELPRVSKEPSEIRLLSYKADDAKDIIAMCRSHGVKLTSLLAHVGLLASKSFTGEFDSKTVIPTNARPLMSTELDISFGLFMGHVDFLLPPIDKINGTQGFNWDVTKRIHNSIHDGYKASCYDLGLLSLINPKQAVEGSTDAPFIATLEVSNVGTLPLKEMWFDQLVAQTLFGMSVASGTEKMNISLRSLLKAEHLNLFHDEVKATIETLLNEFKNSTK